MKRVWMKFSLCTSAGLALALVAVASPVARAQSNAGSGQVNELLLGGLRPGRDSLNDAFKRYKQKYLWTPASLDGKPRANAKPGASKITTWQNITESGAGSEVPGTDEKQWRDPCTGRSLALDVNGAGVIQQITISSLLPQEGKCDDRRFESLNLKDWTTGRGLRIGDPRDRVVELYGEPSASGPVERDNYELEALDFSFAWAGRDVPQSMRILCARDSGRVVEMTLTFPGAAQSKPAQK